MCASRNSTVFLCMFAAAVCAVPARTCQTRPGGRPSSVRAKKTRVFFRALTASRRCLIFTPFVKVPGDVNWGAFPGARAHGEGCNSRRPVLWPCGGTFRGPRDVALRAGSRVCFRPCGEVWYRSDWRHCTDVKRGAADGANVNIADLLCQVSPVPLCSHLW